MSGQQRLFHALYQVPADWCVTRNLAATPCPVRNAFTISRRASGKADTAHHLRPVFRPYIPGDSLVACSEAATLSTSAPQGKLISAAPRGERTSTPLSPHGEPFGAAECRGC
jgi:hypothetical protein